MRVTNFGDGLKRLAAGAAMALAAALGISSTAAAKTELLVYTAAEADELAGFKQAFEKDNPDIEIKWVRDSTGIITSKLLAEKANPQADVVWGLAGTSLMVLAEQGYFQAYAPKGLEKLDASFRDKSNPPLWVGQRAYAAAVCFNTAEGAKKGLPAPATWKDLTKPVYKGAITMPNPNSSGTGFLMVSSWLQMMGEAEGWKFMDQLHENVAWYTHSGSKPCRQSAAGEVPLGISFDYRAAKTKSDGAPVDVVLPKEGLGWEMEAFGIVKGTKKVDAARKFADWSVTQPVMENLYTKGYALIAMPGVSKPIANLPADLPKMLAKNDFGWAAKNRERILDEWRKRYDAKSEPKT
jgi:iron(III) transport system substrate-binding protein